MFVTKSYSRWIGSACVVAAMTATSALAQGTRPLPTYLMSDLGVLDGDESAVVGLNDKGVVVGWAEKAGFQAERSRHAFLWSQPTGMIDLGTLGGASSEARGVNNEGIVVGVSETEAGQRHGFLGWIYKDQTVMWDLNDLVPTGKPRGDMGDAVPVKEIVEAVAINDGGFIVACGTTWLSDELHGFLLEPHDGSLKIDPSFSPHPEMFILSNLGRLPGADDCLPTAINAYNGVVGISGQRAFFWEGDMIEMNGFRGERAANGLNNHYVAVGSFVEGRQGQKACAWYCGKLGVPLDHRLNPIGAANDLNDGMTVVGWSAKTTGEGKVATMWNSHNDQIDLNAITIPSPTSPVKFAALTEAIAIDAAGRIAVNGRTVDGKMRAVLLTPATPGIPDKSHGFGTTP